MAEFLYEGNLVTKPFIFVIACFVKLLRIPIPCSMDIPPVESLRRFRTGADKIPSEIVQSLREVDADIQAQGFTCGDLIGLTDVQHNTRYGSSVYHCQTGESIVWVRYRLWTNLEKHQKFPRVAFYSLGHGGEIILTTAATRDLLDPPHWHVQYHPKCEVAKLADLHREHVSSVIGNAQPLLAADAESAMDLLEHTHQEFVDFQVERGVFKPLGGQQKIAAAAQPGAAAQPRDTAQPGATARSGNDELISTPVDAAPVNPVIGHDEGEPVFAASLVEEPEDDFADMQPIIDAVRKQESKQSGWLTKLAVLGLSIAFFVGLGALQWGWELVLLLVPILFVHELGHYIAMKACGYKNIHMFFVPFLGAAVTGRNYRVASWKKALVSLAGPVPSILLAFPLGIAGYYFENELCNHAAIITLVLNILNLAPFLPLDGGQIAHLTLFSRSKVLDLVFRIGTALLLLGFAALFNDKILIGLGITMLVALPAVWKTMQASERVRNQQLPPPENDQMSPEAIRAVVGSIQQSNLPSANVGVMAKMTLDVYESVITKPPSWPATIAIWATYFGSLFLGVVGLVALALAAIGAEMFNEDFGPGYKTQYQVVSLDDGQFRMGKLNPDAEQKKLDLLVWQFASAEEASAAFEQLRDSGDHSVSRLGDLVFTGLPSTDYGSIDEIDDETEYEEEIERVANSDPRLEQLTGDVWRRLFHPDVNGYPSLVVTCDPETSQKLIDAISSTPGQIGDHAPIAPWTPKLKLTDEQREAQKTLNILRGTAESLPWMEGIEEPVWTSDAEVGSESFRDMAKRMAERTVKIEEGRRTWITERAAPDSAPDSETASKDGTDVTLEQKLCRIFLDFEQKREAWSQDERPFDQRDEMPDVNPMLEPLLGELGFLTPDHPLSGTSVAMYGYEVTDVLIEDRELRSEEPGYTDFPLSLEGQSAIRLRVTPLHDAAAGFACVLAWLKNQGVSESAIEYSVPIFDEESE